MIDRSRIARSLLARGWLVAALAGCHSEAAPQTPMSSRAPTCEQLPVAVNNALPAAPPEFLTALDNVVVQRCTQDAWSEPARRCIVGVKSDHDIQACKTQLTDAQRDAIERDSDAAIEKIRVQTEQQLDDSDDVEGQRKEDLNAPGGGMAPASAPPASQSPASAPPPPPIAPSKRAPAPARDADPCAGGK
jgi:hypothetical protein